VSGRNTVGARQPARKHRWADANGRLAGIQHVSLRAALNARRSEHSQVRALSMRVTEAASATEPGILSPPFALPASVPCWPALPFPDLS